MTTADKKSDLTQISQATFDESNQAVRVNVVSGGGSGTSTVDLTEIGGNPISTDTGASDSGTQRVVLASDQPTIPVDIQDTSIAVDINKDTDSITIYTPDNNTTAIPVSAASLPLPAGAATESTLSGLNTKVTTTANGIKVDGSAVTQPVSGSVSVSNFSSISGLSIPAHDYISLSYTGGNLTGVVYRTGGSGGTIVGTLTLAYSGSDLISVTKS